MDQYNSSGHMQDFQQSPEPPVRKNRSVSLLTVFGVILLSAGLICLGWVAWQYYGTNIVSDQKANQEVSDLLESWTTPTTEPASDEAVSEFEMGTAQWLMRIPAFGDDWVKPIVTGVEDDDLTRGIGWYPETSQAGEVGNFAVAGHRITKGEPFRRLLELQVGDQIIVESREAVFTYELISAPGELTVQDTESWVIDPVPGEEDVEPTEALITLTTCEDLFHSPDRSVGFGKLVNTEMK